MLMIRPARREDHAAFARLFPELGVPDPVPEIDPWWSMRGGTTLVAEQDGDVVGYAWYELVGSTLYIRNVVSDVSHRRQGIGRRLMEACIERTRAAGAERWCLNVKEDNVPAIRLYESMGLRLAYAARTVRVRWSFADRAREGTVQVRPLTPEDDAFFEATQQVLQGQLPQMRRQGRVLLGAFDETGKARGLAAFDPGFPGAFPFRADDLDTALVLLAEMRKHRRHFSHGDWRFDCVQVVIERDEALADALEALGGERVLRFLHLDGALPSVP